MVSKSAVSKSAFLFILCGLVVVACQDHLVSVVSDPQIISAGQLPPLQNQYYLIRTTENAERLEYGAIPMLQQLLNANFDVQDAWYPIGTTPCMAMGAVDALVVRLKKPDDRIAALGFTPDPSFHIINCGIDTFAYYRFD